MKKKNSKINTTTKEELQRMCNESSGISDVLRKMGLSTNGGSNHNRLKFRLEDEKIDCSMFKENYKKKHSISVKKIPLEEILVENSSYSNFSRLKLRLFSEGLLDCNCSVCGIDEWMGEKISLQMDHINGVKSDNRIENLRIICPNCHSQTKTYAGKNKKKREMDKCNLCDVNVYRGSTLCRSCENIRRSKMKSSKNNIKKSPSTKTSRKPPKEILKEEIGANTWVSLGRKYGVSDNAVRKWAKGYGLL